MSRSRGLAAKKSGDAFERELMMRCAMEGIGCLRIPNGCKWVGANRVIPVKSPFDFILVYEGKIAFIDAKYRAADRLRFSDIEPHQLRALKIATKGTEAIGGYLCKLGDELCFFDIAKLSSLGAGGSLAILDSLYLGLKNSYNLHKIFK